jgi:DNA-binding LacI/PurR family transcriptional regulator
MNLFAGTMPKLDSENRATMQDVALRAGVSIATVSRVFNGSNAVVPATAMAVESAAKSLGFRPNLVGRHLREKKTKTIGVMLPTISHPVFAECLQSMEAVASENDVAILFASTGYNEGLEERASELLLQRRVDGLILTVANATTSNLLIKLDEERTPYVLAYNQPMDVHRKFVSVNNQLAADEMVQHLIALGHTKIQMVLGKSLQSDRSQLRYEGYVNAINAHGLEPTAPVEVDFLSKDFGFAIEEIVNRNQPPSALFCSNDQLAMTVISQLQRLGISVPDDISIAGFDGIEIGQLMSQRLTSIAQPNSLIGRFAIENLLKLIDKQPSQSTILSHSILIGDTAISYKPSTRTTL